MKLVYLALVFLMSSCNSRNSLSPKIDRNITVAKHKDTIMIKNSEYTDTFVKGRDSMFYDTKGVLVLSIKRDTVIYKDTDIGGSHGVKVIRKTEDDLYCTSWYLYFASKKFTLRKQILYNSKFDILGVTYQKTIEYIQ